MIIVFDILCFSGLVPNVITPSLMGAYNPWTPNTTQPKDWRYLFSREWCWPIICLIVCLTLVIRGLAMWHSITLMSDMHTDDIVLPPVPPATLQRWCPALSFLINTRKTNKVAIHLKFQSINNPPMVSLASSTGQRNLLVYTLDIKRWK